MAREKLATESQRAGSGFTLVEIMVVVVIIGLMALFAAPELAKFGPNMRIKGAARDLYSNIQKMKSVAVKRNSNVVMLITPVVCAPGARVPSPGGSYQIFIDNDNSGAPHNGTEEWLSLADSSGDAPPDIDYDMPKNTAICKSNAASFGFNSRGLFLNPAVTIKLYSDNDDGQGLNYNVDVSLAGSVKTKKQP